MKTKILLLTVVITLSLNSFSQTFTLTKITATDEETQKIFNDYPELNPMRFIKIKFKRILSMSPKMAIRYSSIDKSSPNPLKSLGDRIMYKGYGYEKCVNEDYGKNLKWEVHKPIGLENSEDIVMKFLIKPSLDIVIMIENKKENLIIVAEYDIN